MTTTDPSIRTPEQPAQDIVDELAAIVASGHVMNGPECARFVCALYEVECTGGSLHIVTDDGNLDDDDLDHCVTWARGFGDRYGELLATAMRRMRKTARGEAIDMGKDMERQKARAAMPAWLREGRCVVTVERTESMPETMPRTVTVLADQFADLVKERAALAKQVDELQARMTDMVGERRALDWTAQLRHMFQLFDQDVPGRPTWPSKFVLDRRIRLIREEAGETYEAIEARDMAEAIDGFVDLAIVALGGCLDFGVDPRPIWAEVMRANFDKAGGPKSAEGKQQKPPGWRGPEIERLLREMVER